MPKRIFQIWANILLLPYFMIAPVAYAQSMSIAYLSESAINYYNSGKLEDALSEFNKILAIDPSNKTAKQYIEAIFERDLSPNKTAMPRSREKEISRYLEEMEGEIQAPAKIVKEETGRDEAIENALGEAGRIPSKTGEEKHVKDKLRIAGINISGEAQARLGITSGGDVYWKRANWDLNEKNFRVRSTTALDRKENTYDPRLYDRLKLKLETDENKEGLGFYSNIVVDPWSFTGKSARVSVNSDFGDSADIELKYWSNTGYIINETINSNRLGNSFNLPETKVSSNSVNAFNIQGAFEDAVTGAHDIFHIPELKIYRQFQPVREFWFDYNQNDNLKLRFYPLAYENQSLTFDDPLKLSNNRIWWEDSPWLRAWKPGNFNSGTTPQSFTKGFWDNTLSFFTRDSEGQRLTGLRGLSLDFLPQESTSFVTSVATPKTLWQDYSEVDNVLSASRLKHSFSDNFKMGLTYTARIGIDPQKNRKIDAKNYVGGVDLGYEIFNGLMASAEFSQSQSNYDLTNERFRTKQDGNAYYFSLVGRYPFESILNTEYGYNGIKQMQGESSFTKFRIFAARMDDSFDEPLSSYVETRDDEWWSRHIHFRKPFKNYYQGEGQLLTWDDIKNYAIGNGIDIGRNTFGLRVESSLWEQKVNNLLDVRNVHDTNGKFLENVSRDEFTMKLNEKLTTKILGIYHRIPKTKGGLDPFIFNTQTRTFFDNANIADGLDASTKTGSLGLEYAFFDWLALNGIWEYTNDYSLAYDNFPRGILNDGNNSLLSYTDSNVYRAVRNFLTDQQHFPTPPYPYYNIFKAGLRFNPIKNVELYLDYTRNPFEKAGQVDDNMNHVGFEIGYTPMPKLSFFLKYTYSRWQDLDKLLLNINKLTVHHNFFAEVIYRKSTDEDFTLQYGEASRDPYMGGVLDIGWDPYGGSLRTIDTQHIFRLYYRRKF